MKKLISIILTLVLLLSLNACTPSPTPEVPGDSSDLGGQQKEFFPGKIINYTYISDFLGLSCNIARDWYFYTEEQIRELNNLTMDLAGEEYLNAIKNASVVNDMFASSNAGLENVNVVFEKVDPVQLALLDVSKNYEAIMPTLKSTYENMGYSNIQMTIGTATMINKEFPCLNTTATINGITMYQTQISIKCSDYLASITVTSFNENTNAEILKFFHESE